MQMNNSIAVSIQNMPVWNRLTDLWYCLQLYQVVQLHVVQPRTAERSLIAYYISKSLMVRSTDTIPPVTTVWVAIAEGRVVVLDFSPAVCQKQIGSTVLEISQRQTETLCFILREMTNFDPSFLQYYQRGCLPGRISGRSLNAPQTQCLVCSTKNLILKRGCQYQHINLFVLHFIIPAQFMYSINPHFQQDSNYF